MTRTSYELRFPGGQKVVLHTIGNSVTKTLVNGSILSGISASTVSSLFDMVTNPSHVSTQAGDVIMADVYRWTIQQAVASKSIKFPLDAFNKIMEAPPKSGGLLAKGPIMMFTTASFSFSAAASPFFNASNGNAVNMSNLTVHIGDGAYTVIRNGTQVDVDIDVAQELANIIEPQTAPPDAQSEPDQHGGALDHGRVGADHEA